MRKGGSKAKGASFERDICKRLSLWVSHGKNEDCFWRSAMSGGRSTVAHAKGKRLVAQSGDISCIHPLGQAFADKFYMECKDYKDLNFIGLLKGKGNLAEFWCETVIQARRYNKIPLLIAHQARQPIIACVPIKGDLPAYMSTFGNLILVTALNLSILLFEDLLRNDVVDR